MTTTLGGASKNQPIRDQQLNPVTYEERVSFSFRSGLHRFPWSSSDLTFTFTMTQTAVPCTLLEVLCIFMGKTVTRRVGGWDSRTYRTWRRHRMSLWPLLRYLTNDFCPDGRVISQVCVQHWNTTTLNYAIKERHDTSFQKPTRLYCW